MSAFTLPIILLGSLVVIKLLEWVLSKKTSADPEMTNMPELAHKPSLADDVQAWIDRDFAEDERNEATYTLMASGLDDRCQRCALYLAEGKLPQLARAVNIGLGDWRELIVEVEYEGPRFPILGKLRRVRDFSQPQTISGS